MSRRRRECTKPSLHHGVFFLESSKYRSLQRQRQEIERENFFAILLREKSMLIILISLDPSIWFAVRQSLTSATKLSPPVNALHRFEKHKHKRKAFSQK
jgi:hypothetical protein